MTPDLIVGLVALVTLFVLEGALPFYRGADRAGGARFEHGLRNGSLMLVNGAVGALLAPLVLAVIAFGTHAGFGLGHWLTAALAGPPGGFADGPGVTLVSTVAVLLAFDLWMYLWHRANHEIGLLWRFHQVHHTDRAMDSTTALRFHPGELVLSTLLNLPVLLLLGLSLGQFVLYKSLMLIVILFHHSNLRVPAGVDRRLGWVLVPPSMHRVHHSRLRRETDSNYGTLFSFWDRLFGSFRRRADQADIAFGTGRRDDDAWQTPWRLLLLPLQPPLGATAGADTDAARSTLRPQRDREASG